MVDYAVSPAKFSSTAKSTVSRIYTGLAIFATLLLSLNLLVGLTIGDLSGSAQRVIDAKQKLDEQRSRGGSVASLTPAREELNRLSRAFKPIRQRATMHKLLGIAAALVAILVHSISITYFVGTSRWCKEVVERYHLDPELALESARLKRRSFPWALIGLLMIVLLAGLGGASDPGGNWRSAAKWVTPHLIAAFCGIGVTAFTYTMQLRFVSANLRVIDRILAEVRRIRQEHGLGDDPAGQLAD